MNSKNERRNNSTNLNKKKLVELKQIVVNVIECMELYNCIK
ncbi:hypothetical protein Mgra_00005855 [Meloidogyne graminicola]|uniref:Uncharacterized protein n=1 Tax=Meloidogyne graminicola TaxID=189291 RepID=A0A8S9ZNF1_9BILA|nr:hypothetical protein Mgra_00005855 [Meloidogyne graminicola]